MKNRPEQTIAYRVYYGGTDMLGIASVEMPQVQYITETISGSGVAGEYESPAKGMTQSMTAKLSFISQTTDFYKLFEPGRAEPARTLRLRPAGGYGDERPQGNPFEDYHCGQSQGRPARFA